MNPETNVHAEAILIDDRWHVRYQIPGEEHLIEVGPYRTYAEFVAAALEEAPPLTPDWMWSSNH